MTEAVFADRTGRDIEQGTVFAPQFDRDGLLPVIATDAATGEVLMFAWTNATGLELTLTTGYAHYWSRSRAKLWQKGEDSGNRLRVIEARTDCDQDVLWLTVAVEGQGVACHTGARSCFYRTLKLDGSRPVALTRPG